MMKFLIVTAFFLIALPAFAEFSADAGLDLRIRYEFDDHFPAWPNGETDRADYLRVRTRVWGRVDYEKIGLFIRLADEFRYYRTPKDDPAQNKQKFPDVLFVDNLYLDVKPTEALDLRIGRQDMALGSGRIFLEGTGSDGSRSAYFDALRATWRIATKSKVDAFALYSAENDWLPTLGKTHNGKGRRIDYDTTGFNNDEAGLGLYAQIRESDALGIDFYWIWKHESASPKFTARDFHTVGARLLPRLTETLSGEIELAGQFGETDDDRAIRAGLAFAGLTWQPTMSAAPRLTAAVLYLSGDNNRFDQASTGTDTGWNAPFGRDTQVGNVIDAMYDKSRYSNLIYPYLELGLSPAARQNIMLQLGPMFTARTERGVNDGEGGSYRGFYVQTRYDFPILEKIALKGTLLAEYMRKGDYFADDAQNSAYLLRFQLSLAI